MLVVVPDEFQYLYVQNDERPVVKIPADVLRAVAAPVPKITKKTQFLIDDMVRIMKKASGIGLAAPQVGVSSRLIVIAPDDMKPMALINPRVIREEGEQIGQEGCLSIPGLYGDVIRAAYIEVEAIDRRGNLITLELEGLPARVVLHEVDHLDGVLFTDKVDPKTLNWRDPDGPDD
ncbi:Def N-formylmethionyl-tRNA deformylase [Fimbriimonadaceae bacterium]|jgi:peptide deformylase